MNNLLTRKEIAEKLNWSLKKLDRMIREHRDTFPRITFKDGTMVFPDGDVLKKFAPDPEREKEPEAAPDPFEEEAVTPVYDDTPKPTPEAAQGMPPFDDEKPLKTTKPKAKPKPTTKK